MTITPYAPTSNGVATTAADQSSRGVARLTQWGEAAQVAHELAVVLCQTTFCPEPYRNQPGEATAAILAGAEVGLSPLAALNAFDPIQGRAAAKAITLRAVALSFGHEIELVESTAARCRMRGRRRGAEAWQVVEWTVSRAQQLGLANKNQWRTQPTAMLVARATSEICRLVAADAILGIGYSVEELEDALAEKPATARKVQRQAIAAKPAPEPQEAAQDDNELLGGGTVMSTTEEPPKAAKAQDVTPAASAAQLKMLGVNWSRLDVTDDLERRTLTGLLVGRDIGETTKNLTVSEASGLIERLAKVKDREQLEDVLHNAAQSTLPPPSEDDPPF